tara:strand:+ start:1614 stop:1763 length:150 start_codon:yes stop_codon:yes gene_type:complete
MSNHENEMLKENIFDMWVEYLELDGWPKGDLETYREAARRTESEWLEMN